MYQKELDKCLWEKDIIVNKSKFKIGIYHYQEEGQQTRIGITRFDLDNAFQRLGRFNSEEITAIIPILEISKIELERLKSK